VLLVLRRLALKPRFAVLAMLVTAFLSAYEGLAFAPADGSTIRSASRRVMP